MRKRVLFQLSTNTISELDRVAKKHGYTRTGLVRFILSECEATLETAHRIRAEKIEKGYVILEGSE